MKIENLQNAVLLLWIIFAVIFCVGAIQLKVGDPGHPGPGFMPLLIGVFMGVISFVTLIKGLRAGSRSVSGKMAGDLFSVAKISKPGIVYGAIFIYGLLVPVLGYLLSTFGLMLVLFKGIAPQKWGIALIAAAFSVILSYYIFVVWLGCQILPLPKFLMT
jgi:hypothetical protein